MRGRTWWDVKSSRGPCVYANWTLIVSVSIAPEAGLMTVSSSASLFRSSLASLFRWQSSGFAWNFKRPWASLVAHMVKNAIQETQVQSLGGEDPLGKGMATHCSIFAWRIPWTEKPGGLQSMGLQRVGHNWGTKYIHTYILITFLNSHF